MHTTTSRNGTRVLLPIVQFTSIVMSTVSGFPPVLLKVNTGTYVLSMHIKKYGYDVLVWSIHMTILLNV
jgi:hypothetical protein